MEYLALVPYPQPLPTPAAPKPQKEEPMTDAIVAPAGQTVIDGSRGHAHTSDHPVALVAATLASDHRVALQMATDGRFTDRNHADTLKSLGDIESRSADRFQAVLNAVKEENSRTRELILDQKTQDLRFANLRFEIAAAAK